MEVPMLNVFASMMNVATMRDVWGAPDHWRTPETPRDRCPQEREAERSRQRRAFRDVGRL
jgi:hypothetical protein